MPYIVYLNKMILPVTPSAITMQVNNKNTTLSLINGEEINILKAPSLTDITFDCMIPQNKYPFAVYSSNFLGAKYYLDEFEKMKTKKKPFPFIVSRTSPSGKLLFATNINVSLEDYAIKEDAAEGLDLIVSINLKQYNAYSTKNLKIEKDATGKEKIVAVATTRQTSKEIPKTYTVKAGDTLWSIVKKLFGAETLYNEILAKNNIINPNLIAVGQVINLELNNQS